MTELESHLVVDPLADAFSRASIYSYKISVLASADKINWTDITSSTSSIGPVWYGAISDNVYGWSFQVSGINYNSALLSPGCYVRLSRSITTPDISDYVESWMTGRVMPSPVQFSYQLAGWSVQVVDDITYLARKKASVFSIGSQNIAVNSSVDVDSSTDASAVSGEGEFYGSPPLTAQQAIDGDRNSLWISTKAPDPNGTNSLFPYEDYVNDYTIVLNELYYKGYSPLGNQDQWFEVVCPYPGPHRFRLLTRSGGIEVADVTLGRAEELPGPLNPDLNHKVAYYGVLCYDAERHSASWGSQPDVPISEYKNALYSFSGSVEPDAFNFNADGQGDFLAMSQAGNLKDGTWKVFAVVDGPKMRRFDKGFFNTNVDNDWPFVIRLTDTWGENELAGCFIRNTAIRSGWQWNCCRRIATNTASVASPGHPGYYNVTVTVTGGWWDTNLGDDDNRPQQDDALIIRPWPEYVFSSENTGWMAGGHGWEWREDGSINYADYHMLAALDAGESYRKHFDGQWMEYLGEDDNGYQIWGWLASPTWQLDMTPSPGPSGGYTADPGGHNDPSVDKYFPWIKTSPARIAVVTTDDINNGDTIIRVVSTEGLLQSHPDLIVMEPIKKALVAGTSTAVEYSNKTGTTLELVLPWSQGPITSGTAVYQFEDEVATDVWPISSIVIKRRRVPGFTGGIRVIEKANVFISFQDSPRSPEEDDWRESWDSASNPINPNGNPVFTINGNTTQDVIEFRFLNPQFTRNYSRPKHILVSIKKMSDTSRGRINELELIPPQDATSGLQNSTVAEFFAYALQQLGIPEANIQVSGASTELTGTFSTDTSVYLDVLSDMATRTGQIVWSGPNLQARVTFHPNWPSSPAMISWLTIDNESASDLEVSPYTGFPISQLQVTVRDSDGNTDIGVYPPIPLSFGEVVVEPTIRTASITQSNNIARMIFNERSLSKLKVTISGPAPWARPGAYRVDMNYTLPNGIVVTGPYYISGVEHRFLLGGVGAPRSWITSLELTKISGAS